MVTTTDPVLLEANAFKLAAETSAFNYALIAAVAVLALVAVAELVHLLRVKRIAPLAFGPKPNLILLAFASAALRVFALTILTWGLTLLSFWPAKSHQAGLVKESEYRHLVLVLDVSPSMQLKDAGPGGTQTRAQRAADIIQSFFERVAAEKYKTTIIAFYTDAKPVVKDTADREVIRNILTELPMRHAFKAGETNIFSGLEKAAEIAKPWNPGSAVVMLVTDGDTIPAVGMPKMPASVGTNVVIVGLGNPSVGKSISGHSSKQDVSTLRQTATRLNGVYHDGNDKHLSTELVSQVDDRAKPKTEDALSLREYAIGAAVVGAALTALVPFLLSLLGTLWTPGISPHASRASKRDFRPADYSVAG